MSDPNGTFELHSTGASVTTQTMTPYLKGVKYWLGSTNANPERIAQVRVELSVLATHAKKMNLREEVMLDLLETLRRAEYALARAIRRGQAEGRIAAVGDRPRDGKWDKIPATTFYRGGSDAYALTLMGSARPAVFEAALAECRTEGVLSRASLVRKLKGQKVAPAQMNRGQRANKIRELAGKGFSSRQMVDEVGITEDSIRLIARDYDIEIPADKALFNLPRKVDRVKLANAAITELEDYAASLKYLDLAEVELPNAAELRASVNKSIATIRKFINKIKETTDE